MLRFARSRGAVPPARRALRSGWESKRSTIEDVVEKMRTLGQSRGNLAWVNQGSRTRGRRVQKSTIRHCPFSVRVRLYALTILTFLPLEYTLTFNRSNESQSCNLVTVPRRRFRQIVSPRSRKMNTKPRANGRLGRWGDRRRKHRGKRRRAGAPGSDTGPPRCGRRRGKRKTHG